MGDMRDIPDAAVNALAKRQDGIIGRGQALRLGLTVDHIRHRVATGRWVPLHRGVYLVGQAPLSPRARYLAAVLGAGPGALLSHRSATGLWRVQPRHLGPVHVVAAVSRAHRPGLVVHRTRRLPAGARTTREGVPVTSLARTLIDLADVADAQELETAIRAAERLHDFDRELLVPIPGRRATGRFDRPRHFTRGALEAILLRLLRAHGLALPECNVRWKGFELDAVWWDAGLVLEVDDWETHQGRDAFVRDRRRARALQAAGFRAIQATYEDLTTDSDRFVAELRHLGVGLA